MTRREFFARVVGTGIASALIPIQPLLVIHMNPSMFMFAKRGFYVSPD